jgi:FtsH-binding integral membrane protein
VITITEPATLATDYLLALFTGWLGRRLLLASRIAEWNGLVEAAGAQHWWSVAFMATAVAGAAGGTVHGFQQTMARPVTNLLWIATLESLIVAAFAVVSAAIIMIGWRRTATFATRFAAAVAFGSYGLWVAKHPVFLAAIAAYGVALAVLLAIRLVRVRPLDRGGRFLIAGIVVSVIAAAVQQSGWSLHPKFNHNDLYHVIQAVGVWLLYRSAMNP